MESTMASRNCSNFSFCALVKASSRRGLWLSRNISVGESDVCMRPALGRAAPGFALTLALFPAGRLAAFFASLASLRAAGFFGLCGVAFFFDLAIKITSRDALA